jgi:hypothetical protein
MGVDAHFFVRSSVSGEDIVTALKALGKTNVRWQSTSVAPGYFNIFFDSKDKENQRMIHFHSNVQDEYFGMNCHLLSLRSNEESIEVFKALAAIFGGVLQEQDCDDYAEIYRVPGAGNFRWLVEQFYANNPNVEGNSSDEIEAFVKWYEEKHK